jgi:hypothetical protein
MKNLALTVSIAAFAIAFYAYRMSIANAVDERAAEKIVTFGPNAGKQNFTEAGLRYRTITKWARALGLCCFLIWAYLKVSH